MKSTQSNSLHSKSSFPSCPIPATKFPEYPKNPGGGGETQHGRGKAAITELIHPGVAAPVNRTTAPVGKLISTAQGCADRPAVSLIS